MVNQKELQEKIMTYRILQAKLEESMKQREILMNRIIEIDNSIESLNEAYNNENETLFPMGAETYVIGKVTEKKKMLVNIGSNILLEKTFEEGKEILNSAKIDLEQALKEFQHEIDHVSSDLQELTPEIQAMVEKSQG
jgi:prefoldin alpha subunit